METNPNAQESIAERERHIPASKGENNRKTAYWFQVLTAVLLVSILGVGFLVIQHLRNPSSVPVVSLPNESWCTVSGPGGFDPTLTSPQLNGIAAMSANNAWIVGTYADQALVEHWDGSHWNITPTPDLKSSGNSGLTGIAALSANDIWTVGAITASSTHFGPGVGLHTLIEHWDGTHWDVVSSPDASSVGDELYSVSAVATNDIWAVGDMLPSASSTTPGPLVEHWDGSRWSVVQVPTTLHAKSFTQIATASANDIWVVSQPQTGRNTLVHWDGQQWSLASGLHFLADHITPGSAHDIWAMSNTNLHPSLEHWNGVSWKPFPAPHLENVALGGFLVISTSNMWIAERTTTANGDYLEQMEHWDGKSWHAVPQQHANDGELVQMAGAGGKLWAIGSTSTNPLIETLC